MEEKKKRNSFSGSIGFVLAAAGSAVGLGNIWRFPYLAAKDGGGLYLLAYILLAITFGFTLLTTELAIGRKTRQGPATAYEKLHSKWKWLGIPASLVPVMIMPYYCVIGGWVLKYFLLYLTGGGATAAQDGFFNVYISQVGQPIFLMMVFLVVVAVIIYRGVNKGIEAFSKVLMPVLLVMVIGIAVFSLTISYTDGEGTVRTGLQGFLIYIIPDISGISFREIVTVLLDAMGQLFFSLSVAMGIMVTYGSYVRDDDNLVKSINRIELFDTLVAFLAGIMVIPAVYAFMGREGMKSSGPGLLFISLPRVFEAMGIMGSIVGCIFFAMVLFAALTSAISILEAIVAVLMDKFHMGRKKAVLIETLIALVGGIFVCLGYNHLFFDIVLPNGSHAQLLDILDYVSNQWLMPVVAIGTCILIGWVVKPQIIIDEAEKSGAAFGRKRLYIVMVKYIAPVLLTLLLLQSLPFSFF